MITSIVGRLIKKPEVAERIQIPGKHVVNFTVVENRNRGEKRLSVFFNLSLIIGTDAQFDLAMRLDKGTVLLFSAPRITYVRQSDKSETEQTINLYAEADNFKIVAGAGEGSAGSAGALAAGGAGDNFFAPAAVAATTPVSRAVTSSSSGAARNSAARGAATDLSDLSDLSGLDDADDPFAEQEPAPVRSGSPRGGSGARSATAPPQPATASSAGRPRVERPQPSAPPAPRPNASGPATAARSPIAAPPPTDEDRGEDMGEDMADLPDPFAESDL